MSNQNLLVELFVEELPPKALKKIGEAFASVLHASLKAQGLLTETSKCTDFCLAAAPWRAHHCSSGTSCGQARGAKADAGCGGDRC